MIYLGGSSLHSAYEKTLQNLKKVEVWLSTNSLLLPTWMGVIQVDLSCTDREGKGRAWLRHLTNGHTAQLRPHDMLTILRDREAGGPGDHMAVP